MRKFLFAALLVLVATSGWAREAPPAAADPVIEDKMMAIASELRCLVCQNETLADSQAELAGDLRNQIRTQLKQGRTESEIKHYMVARYGDFVLYRPPVEGKTVLLWFGPLLLLAIGLVVLFRRIAQRRTAAVELSDAEHERAARLLSDGDITRSNG